MIISNGTQKEAGTYHEPQTYWFDHILVFTRFRNTDAPVCFMDKHEMKV